MSREDLARAVATAYDEAKSGSRSDPCSDIKRVLAVTTSALAKELYTDMCQIQIAVYEKLVPRLTLLNGIVCATDSSDVLRFHRTLVDNGQLVEHIADSIELSVPVRMRKWKTEQMNMRLNSHLQLENAKWHATWSNFVYESRKKNEDAYQQVLADLQKSPSPIQKEWQHFVLEPLDDLKKRPNTFWAAIQINRCSVFEKRAICHKVSLCRQHKDGILLQRLNDQAMYDIFCDTYGETRRRTGRREWFRRCLHVINQPRRRLARFLKRSAPSTRNDAAGRTA